MDERVIESGTAHEGEDGPSQAELAAVFETHGAYVRNVLRRFGVADSDVADVSQDVFVVVCRKLGGFEGRSSIKTWLYRISARTASDYHRRAHRRRERPATPSIEPTAPETQMESFVARNTARTLREALDQLGDDKRAVFVLYELEEMAMSEVALVLRCPLQTAFSRLYAARKQVNRALARAGWTGGLLAIVTPTRTVHAAAPELRALLEAWRVTLPGAWTLAGLGAQAGFVSQGGIALVAAACLAALAAASSVTAPEPPLQAHATTSIGVLHAVITPAQSKD